MRTYLAISGLCLAVAGAVAFAPEVSARVATETAAVRDTGSSSHADDSSGRDDRRRRDRSRSCKQRIRQIVHYDDLALRAKDQGKTQWQESNQSQIDKLEKVLEARCPEQFKQRMQTRRAVGFYRKLKKAIVVAAAAAKAYFTGGLY